MFQRKNCWNFSGYNNSDRQGRSTMICDWGDENNRKNRSEVKMMNSGQDVWNLEVPVGQPVIRGFESHEEKVEVDLSGNREPLKVLDLGEQMENLEFKKGYMVVEIAQLMSTQERGQTLSR